MTATSEDVAQLAGVSRGAVSQILNGRGERFASSTRDRVRDAAERLGYRPSAAGRTLAKGSSDIILVLLPNTTFSGNIQDIFQDATENLARRDLTLLLHLATSTIEPLDRVIAGMRPRAVVSLTPFSPAERALLSDRGVQAFDPSSTGAGQRADEQIGAIQAQHLIDRGYKRLAFAHLRDARQDPFGQAREDGVRAVCRDRGLSEPVSVQLGIDPDDALRALRSLDLPGTGIACYNDDVATALISAASADGWRIPEDVGIVGMDNTPLSAVTRPPLTTIGYDVTAAGNLLISTALTAIGEAAEESSPPLPAFNLIRRGTT